MIEGVAAFDRYLQLATEGLSGDAINAALAAFARQQLAEVITTGQAPAQYERYVNGVAGATEDSVRAPGPILYVFTNWPAIIREAIAELRKRAPVKSGAYAEGFVVLANMQRVADYAAIPTGPRW